MDALFLLDTEDLALAVGEESEEEICENLDFTTCTVRFVHLQHAVSENRIIYVESWFRELDL